MAELNFIEYNVNANTHNAEDVSIQLEGLGFNQISVSKNGKASMWAANKCVILLNTLDIPTGLTGIGLNSSDTLDGSVYCETTGFNVAKIQGINIYTYPIETFKSNYDNHFTTVGTAGVDSPVDYFAGVVFNCSDVNIVNSINDGLKFRVVRKSPNYITSVCEHNRFNIMWNVNKEGYGIDTLVIKTDSIVDLTALLTAKGFESPAINKEQKKVIAGIYKNNSNLPPKHVTNGWELNLAGKEKSYVLEKNFPDALPNMDLIISQRHNHNGLNEESILYYEQSELQPA